MAEVCTLDWHIAPFRADRWLDAWVLEATGRQLPNDRRYWQRAGLDERAQDVPE